MGVPEAYPWEGLSANARIAVAQACRALQAAGIETRPYTLPPLVGAAYHAHAAIQGYEAWRCLSWEFDEHADRLSPVLRDYLQECRGIGPAEYEAGQAVATQARAAAAHWWQGCDMLLTPSAPDEAPDGYTSTGPSSFNRVWTLLGAPCINVPGAVGDHGAPMGVQLIAPLGADARLLAVARQLEQTLAS